MVATAASTAGVHAVKRTAWVTNVLGFAYFSETVPRVMVKMGSNLYI